MKFEDYLKLDAVNFSSLKHLRRSPKHYAHAVTNQRPDTASMRLGRAVHTATLEPDRFALDYVVWKDGDRRGKDWLAFKAAHDGETILKLDEYLRACAIRDAVRSHPLVAPYLVEGKAEHVLQWTDQRTGLACKARADWIAPGLVLDIKTARDAVDLRAFASTAWRMGYLHQLHFYTAGARAVTGREHEAVIVAVENAEPFDVVVYRLDEDALWLAGEEVNALLDTLVRCKESGVWPGTFELEQVLAAPRWAHKGEDDIGTLEDPSWMED